MLQQLFKHTQNALTSPFNLQYNTIKTLKHSDNYMFQLP
jgi:hypothetical protein